MKTSLLTGFLVLLSASNAFAAKGLDGLEGLEPKYALAAAAVGLLGGLIAVATGRLGKRDFIPLGIACVVVALVPLVGWVNALVLLGVLALVGVGLFVAIRRGSNGMRISASRSTTTARLNPKVGFAPAMPSKGGNRHYQALGGQTHQRQVGIRVEIKEHGSPSLHSAILIAQEGGAFKPGPRNLHGTGIYFADSKTAKDYARPAGGLIETEIAAPDSEFADRDEVVNSAEFKRWCKTYGTGSLGHDIATFVTTVRHQRFLDVDGDVIVALIPPSEADEPVHIEGVTVVAVYDMQGNQVY